MGPFCLLKVIGCLLLTCILSQLTPLCVTGIATAQEDGATAQQTGSDAPEGEKPTPAPSDEQAPPSTEPASTEPASTEPASTEPASTEPASTEPETEPASTEPDTTEPASTDVKAESTEEKSAQPESTESETGEPESESLPEISKLSYEPHIREIFAAHCSECHGEKTAKADMRVDDRDALLSYVAPGDLESSSLWGDYLITTDPEMRMPPAKYGKPLSPMELAAIRVWIEDGAEWPDQVAVPAAPPVVTAAIAPDRSFVQRSWTFVGFFHPAVVHLPIGLLLVSTFFTVLAFVKRETFEPAAFHCLWIGAAGAIAASFAGWAFADIRGYGDFWSTDWNTDLIARHRISGIAVTAAAVLLVLVAFVARRRTSSDLRFVWLAGTLVLAGLVSLVGHQGGELTYGEQLFSRAYEQSFGDFKPTEALHNSAASPR